jgi:hypothetical protein
MNNVEIVGWIATMVTLSSFAMKDILKLRVLNLIGAFGWSCYGLLLGNNPMVITNVAILIIHSYWLVRLSNK